VDRNLSTFVEFCGNARDIVLLIDPEGTLHGASASVESILGYNVAENLGRNVIEFVHPDDLALAAELLEHAEERAGQTETIDVRVLCGDGTYLPFEILPKNLLATHGVVVLTGRNVTDRYRMEAERQQTEIEFRLLATSAPVAIFRLDANGRCVFMNDHWTAVSRQSVSDALGYGYLKVVDHDDRAVISEIQQTRNRRGSAEITIQGTDGSQRTTIARWTALGDDDKISGWVGTLEDISEHRALEARLSHQARHDPLTGLPNRVVINDHLTKAIGRCERSGASIAALFIDLDQFKFLNDSLGHEAGDRLLIAVAERLRGTLRPGDVVGRFGGDEFVAVLADVTSDSECVAFSSRIARTLAEPFSIGNGQTYTCTASIGIARYTQGATAESLLRHADAAMYRAKAMGRDRVAHYIPEMQRTANERLSLEMDLRNAVSREELAVLYQPILSTGSGRTHAVEALVRWDHPVRGRLSPDVFIPIAEESGLIVQIGDWVLRRACRDLLECAVDVNVNLSGRQIQDPELAQRIARILEEENFPADRLVLEITESVLMHDAEATSAVLASLKQLGVSLAVDDFGTGYASLNYLSRFPVDCLKVDRSFVAGLTGGAHGDGEIVRAVVNLAHSLGLAATAEGVEEVAQLDALMLLGCEHVQGFLFAHPLPLDELFAILAADSLYATTADPRHA
jgi:diguanylate cyclase (GGDEF)-like protein/PAS domain S-box-containing protein